jgi:hypothetical protein
LNVKAGMWREINQIKSACRCVCVVIMWNRMNCVRLDECGALRLILSVRNSFRFRAHLCVRAEKLQVPDAQLCALSFSGIAHYE